MSIASAMQQQLIKCTALEGAHFGIRVNGVAAGVTYTKARLNKDSFGMNFTKEQNETFLRMAAQKVPLNKTINSAKDCAASILFLSSDDASIITGEILTVDGGQSLATNTYDEYVKAALGIKFEVG